MLVSLMGALLSSCGGTPDGPAEDMLLVVGDPSGRYKISLEEDVEITTTYNLSSSVSQTSATLGVQDYMTLAQLSESSTKVYYRVEFDEVAGTASLLEIDPVTGVEADNLGGPLAVDEDGQALVEFSAVSALSNTCELHSELNLIFEFSKSETTQSELDANGLPKGEMVGVFAVEKDTFVSTDSNSTDNCYALLSDFKESLINANTGNPHSNKLYAAMIAGGLSVSNLEYLRDIMMNVAFTVEPQLGTIQAPLSPEGQLVQTRRQGLEGVQTFEFGLRPFMMHSLLKQSLTQR